ncbi:MAG: Cinnamate reductase [Dehalococcoidia bacterium]|nr:Cinnamate reductase [Bacillota bacterium]
MRKGVEEGDAFGYTTDSQGVGQKPIVERVNFRALPTGIDNSNVIMARALLQKDQDTGAQVVIIGGGQIGLEVAELLAERGKQITIVEMLAEVGHDMAFLPKLPLMINLRDYGVKILTKAKAKAIQPDGIIVERMGKEEFIEADSIIIAVGAKSENNLETELRGVIPLLYSVGDCKTPGNILDAIHEGFKVGLEV